MNGHSSVAAHSVLRRVGEDILALTAGVGVGAGLMYLCDPDRGRSRRSRLVGEATGLLHRREHRLEKRGKDLMNRLRGIAVKVAEEVAPNEPPSDVILLEHIRARIGHIVANPHEIEVRVEKGVVTLEGKLAHPERRRLREEIRAMAGVKRVKGHLGAWPALNPALLIGLGAGLAVMSKANSAVARTNAAK